MGNLLLILGDQLNRQMSSLKRLDVDADVVWMAEVNNEATKVWCHKSRLVFFFSAMRHFRDTLSAEGIQVQYHQLTEDPNQDCGASFTELLGRTLQEQPFAKVIVTEPGDWFVRQEIIDACQSHRVPLEIKRDDDFYCDGPSFENWAKGKKSLVLEHFYRWLRKQHRILLDKSGEPAGGQWNFDKENRKPFGKNGPGSAPITDFPPDATTRAVIELVEKRFSDHPGQCDAFVYPTTREDALAALDDFIVHRLPRFGDYQDAMWTETHFLNHSRISALLNVHLLSPFEVVNRAIDAYESGQAPINSVEGFVRQIVGWREFVRGIYWLSMPEYIERNALHCEDRNVPSAYWDGESDMNCVRQSMRTVIAHSYAHHIQRLMVLGLYAQLLGVHPRKFHDWHMAMYMDAIDWVSLPNTLGMSQHADHAVVGTKPYCASGNYINRMSNYCQGCRYNPKQAVGEDACPITTLYWDFLDRHRERFKSNGRMKFQLRNLDNKDRDELDVIRKQARQLIHETCPAPSQTPPGSR